MSFNYFTGLFFLLISALLLSSCESILDAEESMPSFIYIDSIQLKTNPDIEGTASHKILDAWLFLNDNPLGVFQLPAHVPILEEGEVKISVLAGIYKDGRSDSRLNYPFYKSYIANPILVPLQTDTLEPIVIYKDEVVYKTLGDFESGNPFQIFSEENPFYTISDPELVFEGGRSLYVETNESAPQFDFGSSAVYELPSGGEATFLEINYKIDAPISVGIFPIDGEIPAQTIFIFEKDYWNKIYVNITDELEVLRSEFIIGPYQIRIKGSLPEGESKAAFYFDNIKLIHL